MSTITPSDISYFLAPCVLDVLAYPIIFIAARQIALKGPAFIGSALTGRPTPAAEMLSVTRVAAGAVALYTLIPAPPAPSEHWWSAPLHSGWEHTWGVAMVLMFAAAVLLGVLIPALGLLFAAALASTPRVRQHLHDGALWWVRAASESSRRISKRPNTSQPNPGL